MSAPVDLRAAARALRELRARRGLAAMRAAIERLDPAARVAVSKMWELAARDAQLRPEDCRQIWLMVAGRGFGKTRTGAEWVANEHEERGPFRGALIAKNADDMRATMIGHPLASCGSPYDPQGLQAVCERRGIPFRHIENRGVAYIGPPKRQSILRCYGAHQADFGRGDGLSLFWADEIAAWPKRAAEHFKLGFLPSVRAKFRDGSPMRGLITTTPKPNEITRWLLSDAMREQVTLRRGSSLENRFVEISAYAKSIRGSREWLQEYEAMLLDSTILLTQAMLDGSRVEYAPHELSRVVVAIDPGLDNHDDSDPTGIVVAGADHGAPANAFVLEDLTAGRLSFTQWAELAVDTAVKYARAFECPVEIVAEINQGGRGGVIAAIKTAQRQRNDAGGIVVSDVHTGESKRARAEPVATLFETNQAHMAGKFYALEQEWITWTEGAASPNRLDACVYAVHALLLRGIEDLPVWSPYE
jgi:phage terminase large subunit-like protein